MVPRNMMTTTCLISQMLEQQSSMSLYITSFFCLTVFWIWQRIYKSRLHLPTGTTSADSAPIHRSMVIRWRQQPKAKSTWRFWLNN